MTESDGESRDKAESVKRDEMTANTSKTFTAFCDFQRKDAGTECEIQGVSCEEAQIETKEFL